MYAKKNKRNQQIGTSKISSCDVGGIYCNWFHGWLRGELFGQEGAVGATPGADLQALQPGEAHLGGFHGIPRHSWCGQATPNCKNDGEQAFNASLDRGWRIFYTWISFLFYVARVLLVLVVSFTKKAIFPKSIVGIK
jgi:hypothetical protein